MRDARRYPRITSRLPVAVCCDPDRTRQTLRTADISLGGVFVVGLGPVETGLPVQVQLGPEGESKLHLNSRVVHRRGDGVGVEFVDNSPATMELLGSLLLPAWDGDSLLEGVLTFSPWHRDHDLGCWMRLTSLVEDWQRLKRH